VIPAWWKRLWWLDRLFPVRGIDFMRKDYEDQLQRYRPKGGV
jgi:hypothetical protein